MKNELTLGSLFDGSGGFPLGGMLWSLLVGSSRAGIVAEHDFSVLFFKLLDTFTDKNDYLTVCGTRLVIGNVVQFVEHFIINSDG